MKDRLVSALPYLALAAAAVLVVVLGQQKRDLIEQVEKAQLDLRRATTEPLRGMYMPAFNAPTVEGDSATIGHLPGEGRQVLLMYTTTCPFCLSSIPAWKEVTAAVDTMTGMRAKVFGVSLDSADVTRQYITKHGLPYPTIRFPDSRTAGMYRAGTVPVTLVLDENGRAVYTRTGELRDRAAIDSVIAAIQWRPAPRDTAAAPQPAQPATTTSTAGA